MTSARRRLNRLAVFLGPAIVVGLICGAAHASDGVSTKANAPILSAWSRAIAHTKVPAAGCFEAAYPLTVWRPVACIAAPQRPFLPAGSSGGGWKGTTGDGHDYAAISAGITSSAVGSFPKVSGLKTESGNGIANAYSLQLNSDFIASKACAGAVDPKTCRGWEQFVYSSSYFSAFMQYWLINYAATCPAGWSKYSVHCFKNSNAVSVPLQLIKQLKNLQLSGTAVKKGLDTLVLTTKDKAYSTTGDDSVVYLAQGWKGTEFNVVGDGGGSAAVFNAGTALSVEIDITDGTRVAPTCMADAGTTGETNNLDLGDCTAAGGETPSVIFVESLAKK